MGAAGCRSPLKPREQVWCQAEGCEGVLGFLRLGRGASEAQVLSLPGRQSETWPQNKNKDKINERVSAQLLILLC